MATDYKAIEAHRAIQGSDSNKGGHQNQLGSLELHGPAEVGSLQVEPRDNLPR